jgi:hypothetical protein
MCLGLVDGVISCQVDSFRIKADDSDRAENAGGLEERSLRFDKIVGHVVERWNMGLSQINEGLNSSGLIKLLGADRVGDYICTSIIQIFLMSRPPWIDTRTIRHSPRRRRSSFESPIKTTPSLVLASPRILLPDRYSTTQLNQQR